MTKDTFPSRPTLVHLLFEELAPLQEVIEGRETDAESVPG